MAKMLTPRPPAQGCFSTRAIAPAQQVLKVGSTPTGVPFTFFDTKSNQIQGVMVDIITEIGKDAGFAVTLTIPVAPTIQSPQTARFQYEVK